MRRSVTNRTYWTTPAPEKTILPSAQDCGDVSGWYESLFTKQEANNELTFKPVGLTALILNYRLCDFFFLKLLNGLLGPMQFICAAFSQESSFTALLG